MPSFELPLITENKSHLTTRPQNDTISSLYLRELAMKNIEWEQEICMLLCEVVQSARLFIKCSIKNYHKAIYLNYCNGDTNSGIMW